MAKVEKLTAYEAKKRSEYAFQKSSFSDLSIFVEYGRNFLMNSEDAALFDEYCDMMWLIDGTDLKSCDY